MTSLGIFQKSPCSRLFDDSAFSRRADASKPTKFELISFIIKADREAEMKKATFALALLSSPAIAQTPNLAR